MTLRFSERKMRLRAEYALAQPSAVPSARLAADVLELLARIDRMRMSRAERKLEAAQATRETGS